MSDAQELTDRWRRMMQRNTTGTARQQSSDSILPGVCYKNAYGQRATVIAVSPVKVTYRRDGYGQMCEMGRDKFLKKFTEVKS